MIGENPEGVEDIENTADKGCQPDIMWEEVSDYLVDDKETQTQYNFLYQNHKGTQTIDESEKLDGGIFKANESKEELSSDDLNVSEDLIESGFGDKTWENSAFLYRLRVYIHLMDMLDLKWIFLLPIQNPVLVDILEK